MNGLIDNLEIRFVGALVAASSSIDDNSTIIDMAGFESVMFVTTINDSSITGVAAMEIQSNTINSDTGMTAVTGTSSTVTSGANDDLNDTLLVSELRKPTNRFVQATRSSATANIAYGEVIAILKPLRRPAEQGATVSDTAFISN